MKKHFALNDEHDTIDLARYLAPLLKRGDVLSLYGDLGSGKTFFTKHLGRALGVEDEIDSPSFVLLKEYHCGRVPLYHLDLYRLQSEGELLDLGIFDMLDNGVVVIEWPRLAENILPYQNIILRFTYEKGVRGVTLECESRFDQYFETRED